MSGAERTYQLLLHAYPAAFRAAYASEMTLVFRAQRRDCQAGAARFWAETLLDVARSAPALRMEALRMQRRRFTNTREETSMKMTMGIAAIMAGALEAMNALQEVAGSGIVNHDVRALLGGTIAMVAGALLIGAGVALLRRSPNANALALAAGITSIVVFVFLALVVPLLSRFAIILGIGFPILLVAFVQWSRSRDGATPMVA